MKPLNQRTNKTEVFNHLSHSQVIEYLEVKLDEEKELLILQVDPDELFRAQGRAQVFKELLDSIKEVNTG